MKKILTAALAVTMCFSLAACGSSEQETESAKTETQAAVKDGEAAETAGGKAILIINGNLGDLGFFDSANRGMERLKNELGIEIQVVETGDDEAKCVQAPVVELWAMVCWR